MTCIWVSSNSIQDYDGMLPIKGCSPWAIYLSRANQECYVFDLDSGATAENSRYLFKQYDGTELKDSFMSELHFRLLNSLHDAGQQDYITEKYFPNTANVIDVGVNFRALGCTEEAQQDSIESVCQTLLESGTIDYGHHADVFDALKKYCDSAGHSLAKDSAVRTLRHNYDLSKKTFISAAVESLRALLTQGIFSPGQAKQPHEVEPKHKPGVVVAL